MCSKVLRFTVALLYFLYVVVFRWLLLLFNVVLCFFYVFLILLHNMFAILWESLRRREGGLERQRPLPGNRFVSFVRASGRAGAREISRYLEGFARWTCAAPAPRPLLCQNGSVLARVF